MEFDIEVDGLDAMAEALGAKLEDVLPAAMKGVWKAAKAVEKDARKLSPPPISHTLIKSIRASKPVINGDAVEAVVKAGAAHAVYVEYGTGVRGADSTLPDGMPPATYSLTKKDGAVNYGQSAQPFMYPAMKKNEQSAKATIANEIRKAVEK